MQRSIPKLLTYEKWDQVAPVLFYILLIGLGLIWLQLGNTWYSKVVPFYDSLSYQIFAEDILREYQVHGWGNIPPTFSNNVSAFLYKVVIVMLAPVLPLARTTLYVYLIPLHLIALAALFNFLRRKTNSLALAFLGPFLYLSVTPFGSLLNGVLDQRMDFATASFVILLWVATLDWAENTNSTKKSLTLGLVAGLALLHRPIMGVQTALAELMLIGYAIWSARQAGYITSSTFLRRIGPAVLVVIILLLPWLVFNAKDFYNYYGVSSYDIGGLSLLEAGFVYFGYFRYYLGTSLILLVGIFLILALVLQIFSWKYFFLVAGLVSLPLVPLVIAGSSNAPVTQMSLAGIGLIPLIFIQKNRFGSAVPVIFTFLALGIAIWNLTNLVRDVGNTDAKERQFAEEVLLRLNEKYSISQSPTYLSGFVLAGGGPAGLASIARLDLGIPFYMGLGPFHPGQFGLPPKETSFSEEELNHATACTLDQVYRRGGILMLVEPSQVEEIQPQLPPQPFSHQLAARIDKLALESGRLEDSGIKATLDGIPVHFYSITTGNFPIPDECR